ncbi:permease [Paenibacillus humicola]|uniref:permease n=1 Tax=Paenibacillus humicola TaxID=3110540 RepID=UPI00237A4AF7|nr:permease [Paenibacillus humicola]
MIHSIYRWSLNAATLGVIALILLLLTGTRLGSIAVPLHISGAQWQSLKTVFVSIFLEALPFILLGVFISSLLHLYVSDELLRRLVPRNPLLGVAFACLLGILLPVCECGMIPIVRRLIGKGMPPYIGIAYILAAPIINPVTFAATYMAFRTDEAMVYYRLGLAFAVAAAVGLALYYVGGRNPLKEDADGQGHAHDDGHDHAFVHEQVHKHGQARSHKRGHAHDHLDTHRHDHHRHSLRHDHPHDHHHDHPRTFSGRLLSVFSHASDEFFEMGKYLMIGACLTAAIQTFVSRQELVSLSGGAFGAHLLMMGFAFIISLCSTSDAFIAASFSGIFPKGALLAFLVFGPMVDFKSTLMMLSVFRSRFVLKLIALIAVVVFVGSLAAGQLWSNS